MIVDEITVDGEKSASNENTPPPEPPKPKEAAQGDGDTHEFQAETRKLLDIVAKSLYSEKEVSLQCYQVFLSFEKFLLIKTFK